MKYVPLNFSILGNPWNWIVVLLMIYIVGLALAAIFGQNKLTAQSSGGGGY
jgi:hypothetical protein